MQRDVSDKVTCYFVFDIELKMEMAALWLDCREDRETSESFKRVVSDSNVND